MSQLRGKHFPQLWLILKLVDIDVLDAKTWNMTFIYFVFQKIFKNCFRCTISREILSGYYKSIKAKPFELPEEDDHAFGE